MDSIDVVILYVDNSDPEWIKTYNSVKKIDSVNNVHRFRDCGTFKSLIRSIDMYAPWVNNVYLVVSSHSQVPEYIDRSKVKVVLHEDIIPSNLLPLFNSCGIELFIHKIKGLSEKFLYFNDDMILTKNVKPHHFFVGDRIVQCIKKVKNGTLIGGEELYTYHMLNASMLVKKIFNIEDGYFYNTDHGVSPMLKSLNEEAFNLCYNELIDSVTPFRSEKSISQYFYTTYAFFKGNTINMTSNTNQFIISKNTLSRLVCDGDEIQMVINDNKIEEDIEHITINTHKMALNILYNKKSKYEL